MAEPSFSYDEVPYPGGAFPQSHPDRLATLSRIFGRHPPAVEGCRVLDLGCGSGENLLPMADALPGATFVGIDLSAQQIAAGRALAAQAGLGNVTLLHADILDPGRELGRFDYVISHGVFSWVPRPVQDRILALCHDHLTEEGVAYISYAALPGGHTRLMLRDMMRHHVRDLSGPHERVGQARALAHFLAAAAPADRPVYAAVLRDEAERVGKLQDAQLFHDDLSECYEPLYFHQFMARAREHGLMYLSEAVYSDMEDQMYPAEVQKVLRQSGSRLVYEQYLDFVYGRCFRQTLLCHNGRPLVREITPERLRGLYARALFTPLEPGPGAPGLEKFRSPRHGSVLGTEDPLLKAALWELHERAPLALSEEEVLDGARRRLGLPESDAQERERQRAALGEILLAAYTDRLLDLHTFRPPLCRVPGERPHATPFLRAQAAAGPVVVNRWHQGFNVDDPLALAVLRLLDGRRDRRALLAALPPPVDAERLERVLQRLAGFALLTG